MRGREVKEKKSRRGERASGAGANVSPAEPGLRTPEQRLFFFTSLEMEERKERRERVFSVAIGIYYCMKRKIFKTSLNGNKNIFLFSKVKI